MKNILLLIFVNIFLTSCNEEPVSNSFYQDSYDLWRSHNIHNYSVYQKRICFCPDAGQLMKIIVRSDTVNNVTRVSDNSTVVHPYYISIDSLFSIIRNSVDDSLVIKYNLKYGYPEYLDINPQLHPVDGGVLYETSNLTIQ